MTKRPPQSPFVDLREALGVSDTQPDEANGDRQPFVRIDANRVRRAGIPEVVFAGNKASAEIADALRRLVEANGRALASRVRPEDARFIQTCVRTRNLDRRSSAGTSTCRVPSGDRPPEPGRYRGNSQRGHI